MLNLLLSYLFVFACVMTIPLAASSPIVADDNSDKLDPQRNLDSEIHSTTINYEHLVVPDNLYDSDDLYRQMYLTLFISSNETILSNGNCLKFNQFSCSNPDCDEDVSSTYFVSYPHFSSNNTTRINLTKQGISIADGAWKIKSSLLYMHDCEAHLHNSSENAMGQIGLGLSGKAYQNFQTPNPIFSIFVHAQKSINLIFGLDSAYITDNKTGVSLSCDLDWRVPITSFAIGNLTISTSPMALIFDVRTPGISLPTVYYHRLRNYLLQISTLAVYEDPRRKDIFACLDYSYSEDFPLTLTLEDGTQLIFPQLAYWFGDISMYSLDVRNHNSTFSGGDYIILGRQTLSYYYTVFQQHDDQSTTITLYPLSSSVVVIQENPFSSTSPELSEAASTLGSSKTDTNNTLNPTVELRNPNKSAPNESQSESSKTPTESLSAENQEEEKPEQSVFSLVINVFLIVSFCLLIVFILRKRQVWFGKEERIETPKSTVELNESSHFVSTQSDRFNGDDIDLSE